MYFFSLPYMKSNKEICVLFLLFLFLLVLLHLQPPNSFRLQLAQCLSLAEGLILIVMISFDVTLPGAIAPNGWSVSLPERKSSR